MKTTVLVCSLFGGLVAANPVAVKRQELPISQYKAVANAISATGAPVGNAAPQTSNAYKQSVAASQVVQQITTAAPAAAATQTAEAVSIADKVKRDASCATLTGNGPQVTSPSDSDAAFQSYALFAAAASQAAAPENVPAVLTSRANSPLLWKFQTYLTGFCRVMPACLSSST
jgi:hypothetical protein